MSFGLRLRQARKGAGLSLRAMGEAVGLSHAAIKKYEDGHVLPPSDVLIKLARTLGVRSEWFFRPVAVALESVEYRKRSTLPVKRLESITHKIRDMVERRLELEALLPSIPFQDFTPVGGLPVTIASLDEIEAVAETVREGWGLGLDPIPDMVDLLETHGVRVFTVKTEEGDGFDGLAAKADGIPVVVVGETWPGDRQRFTLAHELGHLMLDGRLAPNVPEERACDRFAGAFLFPQSNVRLALGNRRARLEVQELALLKAEFGLSMMAVVHRAKDLRIISEATHVSLAKLFSARGWRKTEPGPPLPSERSHVFEQMVFRALGEDCIGESKAAELMALPLTAFKQLRSMGDAGAAAHQ